MAIGKLISLLFLVFISGCLGQVTQTLDPENGNPRGDWGPIDLCPAGSTVSSFEFKYESPGQVDDTAGNGIKLYCLQDNGVVSYVTSSEGLYGDWQGIRSCTTSGSYITGVRMEVLGPQGNFGDDLAVTNVQFSCNVTGEVLTGVSSYEEMNMQLYREKAHRISRGFVERNGRKYEAISFAKSPKPQDEPYYGQWLYCNTGSLICGLQTNVEPDHIYDDDAGLTDAMFFCC